MISNVLGATFDILHKNNIKTRTKILKMNKEVGMLLPQKRAITSEVGKSNNYYEDIYMPPYNNTH